MKKTLLLLSLLGSLSLPAYSLELPSRLMLSIGNTVQVSWTAPVARENGDPLLPSELGGYELLYACNGEPGITLNIPVDKVTHTTPVLQGTCEFSIAAYDTNGLYSEWSDVLTAEIEATTGPVGLTLEVSVGT